MGQKREREERPRHSRLPEDTSSYFREVAERLKDLDDDEERQLLADNALEEAHAGVAIDAECSRVVEALLPHVSTPNLCKFTKSCVEGETLGMMCTRWVAAAAAAGAACRRRRHT